MISEQSTGFPGYNSIIGKDKATIGRILKDNGYATSWFGKDHNMPAFQASQAGPFDLWPIGMGFEYFYGFVGGDANQWQPNLFRNTTQIYPFEGKPGWNLTTGMADDAIDYLNRLNQIAARQAVLPLLRAGRHPCAASPHARSGWTRSTPCTCSTTATKSSVNGSSPTRRSSASSRRTRRLSPWPSDILKPWDQTTDDEKKLFIRQVEVFAAYAAYTDHEIGRVIQAVDDMGKLDNTLIIYINGDNGTSAEGGPLGTPNEVAFFNGLNMLPVDVQMKFYDVWGTDMTYNHMSAAWSWAFDTPFSWFKQIASHLGGVRQGMAISWPGHINDVGGIRNQFSHVIDVVPTILEAARHPGARSGGRHQAGADRRHQLRLHLRQEERRRADAPHDAVFRDDGRPRHLQGWLDALSTKVKRAPWEAFGPANPDPLNNVDVGTLQSRQRLFAGRRTSRRSIPTRSRS